MNTKTDIGTQYAKDDEFKAKARLHQSKYRAEVLQVDFKDFGNRLIDDDAKNLLNYYDKLNCRTVLRDKYSNYSRMRDADMLRSEHIPFNLLAPLKTNQTLSISIIQKAFGVECAKINFIEIEHAPSPKENYLNDGTAFDTYINATLPNGKTCGIGIEVKYTEQDYKIGETEAIKVKDHQSLYWKTAKKSRCFKDPDDEVFGTDPLRQIWRNHLLGLAMIERGDIDEFYSITLYPSLNKHFEHVLPQYVALLSDESKSHVFGCTFEKYIHAIGGNEDFVKWREWLERRYIVK